MSIFDQWLTTLESLWLVITRRAIVVPLDTQGESLVSVIELDGSSIEYCRIISVADGESGYVKDLAKILYWVFKKPRFYWASDKLGAEVLSQAEILDTTARKSNDVAG